MPFEDLERILRWAERIVTDAVVASPILLDWEMVSRVQQYNSAHPSRVTITLFGQTLVITPGDGYIGYDSKGNKVPLALPSPLQYIQGAFGGGAGTSSTGTGQGGSPPPPPPPPPGTSLVTFMVTRNNAPFTGAGFLTVNGVNHASLVNGTYTNPYTVGTVLTISFTGLGIVCTPTTPDTYTVLDTPSQDVVIQITC